MQIVPITQTHGVGIHPDVPMVFGADTPPHSEIYVFQMMQIMARRTCEQRIMAIAIWTIKQRIAFCYRLDIPIDCQVDILKFFLL